MTFTNLFPAPRTIALFTFAAASMLSAVTAHAATWTVCAIGCDHTSIQGAIDAASAGDTLALEPEVFLEGDIRVDRHLTIRTSAGRATINADGGQTAIEVDAGVNATLENLRLLNATRAMLTNRGVATLKTVYVLGNGTTSIYGGIVNYSGAFLVLRNASVVANNQSPTLGGGINNFGVVQVVNSTIIGNRGRLGGGIFNSQGQVVVAASSISHNNATVRGGGYANAHVGGGAVIVLPSSSYSGNTADSACDRYYDIHRTPPCVD